ncbi:hypothetical protein D9757_007875 [Collybiopsis confluens]|uniref:Mitochondrial inner membrane protease ATP23 n=1 Tax=Collybiopsis confluens TaxID=2823264 RepID=A0A8H5HDD9_9AGAR|nr:hypothetical protein D9757_007875 [Collybiopsis confluens]
MVPSSSNPGDPSSSSTSPSGSENLSAFHRFLRKAQLVSGIGVTAEERTKDLEELNIRRCEKMKKELIDTSPLLVFMLKHLRLSGCQVPEQNIVCVPCASPFTSAASTNSASNPHPSETQLHAGAYLPFPHGAIKLCAGHFFSKQHVESTIAHELVHMFDECRFKVDWQNLRHHACSEIRANNLSGDCKYTREMRRGIISFTKQHQACVRRRAITSVAANPACPSPAHAERAVNEVWDSCFADTRPFDEIY